MQLIYFAKREFIQRLKTHVLLTNLAALESVQLCSREKTTPFLLSDQLTLCNSTGVTVPQASLCFEHPHCQTLVISIVLSLGFWDCGCQKCGDAPITVTVDNQQPCSQSPLSSSEEHRGLWERGWINQSWQKFELRNYKQNTIISVLNASKRRKNYLLNKDKREVIFLSHVSS